MIVRFECKQLLVWEPESKRYCFDDRTAVYCSEGTFDEYMWHHTLYRIDATGSGQLIVDGVVQNLVDAAGSPLGTDTFQTAMSPTQCRTELYGDEGMGPNSQNCCTTRIGAGCGSVDHETFEGFIDEVRARALCPAAAPQATNRRAGVHGGPQWKTHTSELLASPSSQGSAARFCAAGSAVQCSHAARVRHSA